MWNLFKKKSEAEKLNEQYKKLMEEAFVLSKTDRKSADAKTAEADLVLKKIDSLNG